MERILSRAGEILSGDEVTKSRSMDKMLVWLAVLGPVVTYILGVFTGFAGAATLFRDHDKRIATLEAQASINRDVITALKVKGIIK